MRLTVESRGARHVLNVDRGTGETLYGPRRDQLRGPVSVWLTTRNPDPMVWHILGGLPLAGEVARLRVTALGELPVGPTANGAGSRNA